MKLETMESFFNKGRTSHERFPIVISTPCDGNEVVCEFTAELNGLNVFQQRKADIHTNTFADQSLYTLLAAVWGYELNTNGSTATCSQ